MDFLKVKKSEYKKSSHSQTIYHERERESFCCGNILRYFNIFSKRKKIHPEY